MTSRAAAAAVIAGVIVGAGKREHRIDQARFLQAKEHGIGSKPRPEATVAEFVVRLAGVLLAMGIAELRFSVAAAFENPKHVAGLRDFPAIQRIEFGHDALGTRFFGRRLWKGFDRL